MPSTSTRGGGPLRRPEDPVPAYVRRHKHVVRRPIRPANDNTQPVTDFIERLVVWLVPLTAFALLALAVALES